jgi:hypothetical protein
MVSPVNVTFSITAVADPAPQAVHVPRRLVLSAVAIGIALGAGYAASPLTLWFAVAMIVVFAWAGRGLPARERQWICGMLAVAIALRLALIAVLFLTSDHHEYGSFFWDGDGVYLKRRALWIRNVWLETAIAPLQFQEAFSRSYGWTTYLYVLAYLQLLVGPAPYAIHLFNVTIFVVTAVVLHRLIRPAYGRVAAFLGLALMLFLPTPFVWSVSALKETLYVLLCVIGMMAVITLLRTRSWAACALAAGALVGTIAWIDGVRRGGLVVVTAGLGVGVAGHMVLRRWPLVLLLLAMLTIVGRVLVKDAAIQHRIMTNLKTSAVLHIGNVRTDGHGYKLLDQRFYSDWSGEAIATMTGTEALRFAIRALVSVIIVPLPWQIQSWSEIVFLPQQLLWYALVILALVGLVAGLRRDLLVTCMLAGFSFISAAAVGLNSGNIGSMVRHRDTVVPFVVWLSALGAAAVVVRFMPRRTGAAAQEPGVKSVACV